MKLKFNIYGSLLIIAALFLSICNGYSQDNAWQWISTLGSSNWDYINGIETDSEGNIYLAGAYNGELHAGNKSYESQGKQDLFVAKYTEKGKLKWIWNAGGKFSDKITGLYISDNDEVFVSGLVTGELKVNKKKLNGKGKKLILAKLDSKGKVQWLKNFPIKSLASMYKIYQNTEGFFVAGTFRKELKIEDQIVLSNGKEDLFVAHFTLDGKLKKLVSYGGKGKEQITDLSGDKSNNIYLSVSHDAGFNLGESKVETEKNKTASCIIAINSDFEVKWVKSFNNNHFVQLTGLVSTAHKEFYVSGNFINNLQYQDYELISNGAIDFFAAKLDSIGNPIWMKSFGTPYTDYANNIELNPAGGIMLNGTFSDTLLLDTITLFPNGKSTAFVSQINKSGKVVWAKSIGGLGNTVGSFSTIDKQGSIFLSGAFSGKLNGESFNKSSHGEEDIFIAKYYNCPEYEQVIIGDNYICPNGEVQLKLNGNFDNISWNNGLFADTEKITILEPGVYFVEMTDESACLVQDTIVVEQATGIIFDLGNDTTLFTNEQIMLYGPRNALEYLWYNNITLANIEVQSQGDFDQSIEAWLELTDSLYCTTTDTINISFIPQKSFVNINEASGLQIFPNPASEHLNWSMLCDQEVSLYVDLTNTEGIVVHSEIVYNYISGQEESIPIRHLPAGNYYLSIGNSSEKITKLVVIVNE